MNYILIQRMPPPPPPRHRACSRPNPPWWCNNQPALPIDDNLSFLLIFGLIYGIMKIKRFKFGRLKK